MCMCVFWMDKLRKEKGGQETKGINQILNFLTLNHGFHNSHKN